MVRINMQATGERIRSVIYSHGYSILKVTKILNLSQSAVYKWCWGKQLPTVDHLAELADLLNITMEDLLVIERW